MQFLVYDPNYPASTKPPTPELMAEMGEFIAEAIEAGVLVTTGALQPTGQRLRLSNGNFTLTDAPAIELKELTSGWAILKVNSLDAAVEWCKRFRLLLGDGVSEIVQVFGPDEFNA